MTQRFKKDSTCPANDCYLKVNHGHYRLDGDPVSLKRPRMGKQHMFDAQKEQKLITGISLQQQHGAYDLFEGPLLLIAEFFFKMPVKITKKKREELNGQPVEKKPDLSNLIKYIEDAATTVLYHDDCIITTITAIKRYGDEPHTHFVIAEDNGSKL